ncbi:hypothetical protein [Timonella sp. A28]|uniref:hypothetical protein n=1 Tax=Timonella sp. A28 TaxID=3442640 RepID=UPI003EBDB0CE
MHTPTFAALPNTNTHILTTPNGTTTLRLPTGQFLNAHNTPQGLTQALADNSDISKEAEEYVQALHTAISAREAHDAEQTWQPHTRRIAIIGAGELVAELHAALHSARFDVQHFEAAADFLAAHRTENSTSFHLVIAYADHPGEHAHWDQLDTLPLDGCAWLRAYREGHICFVDPLSLNSTDPTSEHVLRRRTAAHATPHLFTQWRQAVNTPEPLTEAAKILLISRVLTMTIAWAHNSPNSTVEHLQRTLWKFVPATGMVSEHTLLSYEAPYQPEQAATL